MKMNQCMVILSFLLQFPTLLELQHHKHAHRHPCNWILSEKATQLMHYTEIRGSLTFIYFILNFLQLNMNLTLLELEPVFLHYL